MTTEAHGPARPVHPQGHLRQDRPHARGLGATRSRRSCGRIATALRRAVQHVAQGPRAPDVGQGQEATQPDPAARSRKLPRDGRDRCADEVPGGLRCRRGACPGPTTAAGRRPQRTWLPAIAIRPEQAVRPVRGVVAGRADQRERTGEGSRGGPTDEGQCHRRTSAAAASSRRSTSSGGGGARRPYLHHARLCLHQPGRREQSGAAAGPARPGAGHLHQAAHRHRQAASRRRPARARCTPACSCRRWRSSPPYVKPSFRGERLTMSDFLSRYRKGSVLTAAHAMPSKQDADVTFTRFGSASKERRVAAQYARRGRRRHPEGHPDGERPARDRADQRP